MRVDIKLSVRGRVKDRVFITFGMSGFRLEYLYVF